SRRRKAVGHGAGGGPLDARTAAVASAALPQLVAAVRHLVLQRHGVDHERRAVLADFRRVVDPGLLSSGDLVGERFALDANPAVRAVDAGSAAGVGGVLRGGRKMVFVVGGVGGGGSDRRIVTFLVSAGQPAQA